MDNIEYVIIDNNTLKIDKILYCKPTFIISSPSSFVISTSSENTAAFFRKWFETTEDEYKQRVRGYKKNIYFGNDFIIYNAFIKTICAGSIEIVFDYINAPLANELKPFIENGTNEIKAHKKIEAINIFNESNTFSFKDFLLYFNTILWIILILKLVVQYV
jgi:hypothetical protein